MDKNTDLKIKALRTARHLFEINKLLSELERTDITIDRQQELIRLIKSRTDRAMTSNKENINLLY